MVPAQVVERGAQRRDETSRPCSASSRCARSATGVTAALAPRPGPGCRRSATGAGAALAPRPGSRPRPRHGACPRSLSEERSDETKRRGRVALRLAALAQRPGSRLRSLRDQGQGSVRSATGGRGLRPGHGACPRSLSEERSDETKRRGRVALRLAALAQRPGSGLRSLSDRGCARSASRGRGLHPGHGACPRSLSEERSDETKRRGPVALRLAALAQRPGSGLRSLRDRGQGCARSATGVTAASGQRPGLRSVGVPRSRPPPGAWCLP
jgi:hypothetical protein